MLIINLEEKLTDFIKLCAQKIAKSERLQRPSKNGMDGSFETYYGGLRGEAAFFKLFKLFKKQIVWSINTNGQLDTGDFIVFIDGEPKTIDLKTALKDFHTKIMLPKIQKEFRGAYDLYVGAKLIDENKVQLWGSCTPEEFKLDENGFDDTHGSTFYMELNQLTNIQELLYKCDYGIQTIIINGHELQTTLDSTPEK